MRPEDFQQLLDDADYVLSKPRLECPRCHAVPDPKNNYSCMLEDNNMSACDCFGRYKKPYKTCIDPAYASVSPEDWKNVHFYHATVKPNWYQSLPRKSLVHAGSLRAAIERLSCFIGWNGDDAKIYELKLAPHSVVHPALFSDEVDKYPIGKQVPASPTSDALQSLGVESRLVSYLNVCKAPGSLSLAGDKSHFRVVNVLDAHDFYA